MKEWLQEQGVGDLISQEQTRRAYLAFSRCPFGEKVPAAAKVRFFRKLAPLVLHLAIQQLDMGCFTDPRYVMHLGLRDVTPVSQPPMRVTPEVERWLKEWALAQESVGLI